MTPWLRGNGRLARRGSHGMLARPSFSAALVTLALLLGACSFGGTGQSSGPETSVSDQQAAELAVARAAWATREQFYTYELERICQCPSEVAGPYRLTIVDGVVCVVAPVSSEIVEVPGDVFAPTVLGLLELAEQALERGELDHVTFTAEGLPSELLIDPDPDVADDELFIRAALVDR